MRSAVSCEPLVVSFVLSLMLSLALRAAAAHWHSSRLRPWCGGQYSKWHERQIRGGGRQLVAVRFLLLTQQAELPVRGARGRRVLVRTLTGTREYRESAGARSGGGTCDGADASREADAFPGATGVDDSPEEYRPEGDWPSTADESSPLAREDEEDEEEVGALDGTAEAEEEGEIIGALCRCAGCSSPPTVLRRRSMARRPSGTQAAPALEKARHSEGWLSCLRQPTHSHPHTPNTNSHPTNSHPTHTPLACAPHYLRLVRVRALHRRPRRPPPLRPRRLPGRGCLRRSRGEGAATRGHAPGGPWVLLRSSYGGGFVEVVPRGQEDEYVVRVKGRAGRRALLPQPRPPACLR